MTVETADLFEVVESAGDDPDARRLTTAQYVAARMTNAPADATLESYIDEVSAQCAAFCGLARDAIGTPRTFAAESLRATWYACHRARGDKLQLPWRVPVTEIGSVTEGETELDAATDYKLMPGGLLLRLSGDRPICWRHCKIVVGFDAGLEDLSDNAPAELQAAVADQVKYRVALINRDMAVRSENVPDVWSGTFALPGGDNIGASGLMLQVESALAAFRYEAAF